MNNLAIRNHMQSMYMVFQFSSSYSVAPKPVREIRAFAESFNNSDDIAIKLEWDVPPDAYPDYPLTYYVLLYDLEVEYKTHNSTSVTLSPLSRNFTYTFVVRREEYREGRVG